MASQKVCGDNDDDNNDQFDEDDQIKGQIVDTIPISSNGMGNPFNDPTHVNMIIPKLIESRRLRRAFYEAYHEALINLQQRVETDPINRTKYIHGAAVIKGNRIIGLGYNDYSRTYVQGKFYLSLHAELSAMINASLPCVNNSPGKSHKNNHKNFRKRTSKNNAGGFELLVIRINSSGHLRSSRPCVNCIEDMKRRQIRKVFYTDDHNNLISEVISEMVPSPDTRPFVLKSHIS
ncbi:MAG: hypothetical protein WD512_08200 [Candidatus Paceibacterota bacterium]